MADVTHLHYGNQAPATGLFLFEAMLVIVILIIYLIQVEVQQELLAAEAELQPLIGPQLLQQPVSSSKERRLRAKRKRAETSSTVTGTLAAWQENHMSDPHFSPDLIAAVEALAALRRILRPPRSDTEKKGYLEFDGDGTLRRRLETMRDTLFFFTDHMNRLNWAAASLKACILHGRGPSSSRIVCKWTRAFIDDPSREDLPYHSFGHWPAAMIEKGELKTELEEHLVSIGRFIKAQDIVDYVAQPAVQEKHHLKHTISLSTAQSWLRIMGYRWKKLPHGQYVDGHERDDVVKYRQDSFFHHVYQAFI